MIPTLGERVCQAPTTGKRRLTYPPACPLLALRALKSIQDGFHLVRGETDKRLPF